MVGKSAHPAGCATGGADDSGSGPTTTTSSTGFLVTTRLVTFVLVSLPLTYVITVVTCCSPVTPLVCTVREPGSAFGSVFSMVLYSTTASVVVVFVVSRVSVIGHPGPHRRGRTAGRACRRRRPSTPAWSSASPTVAAVVVIVRLAPSATIVTLFGVRRVSW